jgi:hypothetical protein
MKTFKIPFSKGAKGLLWLPSEGIQLMTQELGAKVYRGKRSIVEDLGIISRKLVTTEGVNWIRKSMALYPSGLSVPVFCVGTGSGAEAITDNIALIISTWITGLDAGANNLVSLGGYASTFVAPTMTTGTKTLILESNFDFVGLGSLAITEQSFGFGATTLACCFDRSNFTAINVTAVDKIKFTYTLTFTDGG